MAHKAFKRAANVEPMWFTLPGKDDDEVRFDCEDDLAAGVILAFVDATGGGNEEAAGLNNLKAVHDLFNSAIVDEQIEKFWAMVNDRKGGIGISMLIDVASWLAEEYSARPTGQSSPNGSSTTSTGNGSTDGALPAVVTYSKQTPVGVSA